MIDLRRELISIVIGAHMILQAADAIGNICDCDEKKPQVKCGEGDAVR